MVKACIEMRFLEFDPDIIDNMLLADIEVSAVLKELKLSGVISESLTGFDKIENFVKSNLSKINDPNKLIVGQLYAPMTINSIPAAKVLILSQTNEEYEYVRTQNNVSEFKDVKTQLIFKCPESIKNLGSTDKYPFVFATINERDRFLSALAITFGDWELRTIK